MEFTETDTLMTYLRCTWSCLGEWNARQNIYIDRQRHRVHLRVPYSRPSRYISLRPHLHTNARIMRHNIQHNMSLEWSPDSVWDHRVLQHSSYQLLEGRHWVTERLLSLPPGRGTVCRQQSLLRQPCIHSVEPWKLIYPPHLFHHLSLVLSAFWANVTCFAYVTWPYSLLTLSP